MKIKFSILFSICVGVVPIASMPVQAADGFSYEKNTSMEESNHVSFPLGTPLVLKEKFWRFLSKKERDHGPPLSTGEISHITPVAKVPALFVDGRLVDERVGMYETLAMLIPEYKNSFGFAIRGLPAGTWALQGLGEPVFMTVKDNPYVELVRRLTTDACLASDSTVQVRKSSMPNGREIVKLSIGKAKKVSLEKRRQIIENETREFERQYIAGYLESVPEYKKKRIDKIERKEHFESAKICQFYLDGKRVLKEEHISRIAGPTPHGYMMELDGDNWIDWREDSLGFISMDEGKNWDMLRFVYGFESVNYMIHSLDNSSIVRFHDGR